MTILNYDILTDVPTIPDLMEEIKDFLDGLGWTINEWQTAKNWAHQGGGVYGWSAGTQSYLDVNAVAYNGSQNLRFKLQFLAEGGDAQADWLKFKHNKSTIDTSSSTHPIDQTNGTLYTHARTRSELSLPVADIPKVWMFGSDKFFCACIKCDSNFMTFLTFGCAEIFDTAGQSDGGFYGASVVTSSDTVGNRREWYDYSAGTSIFRNPFDNWEPANTTYRFLVWNGISAINIIPNALGNVTHSNLEGYYLAQHPLLGHSNIVTGIKPLVRLLIYVQISGVPTPVCYFPVFKVNYNGLEMGQVLTYGQRQYIVFPNCYENDSMHGIAFRIADLP